MADKLKWNSWGWFLGNAGGLWIFGKLAYLAGAAGDSRGAAIMAGFVLMQVCTILLPWLRRATFPPGRAAVIHVSAVLAATFVAIWYFHAVAPAIDEQAKVELRRLPWIIAVILLFILGLIGLAKLDEAKRARALASAAAAPDGAAEPTGKSPAECAPASKL